MRVCVSACMHISVVCVCVRAEWVGCIRHWAGALQCSQPQRFPFLSAEQEHHVSAGRPEERLQRSFTLRQSQGAAAAAWTRELLQQSEKLNYSSSECACVVTEDQDWRCHAGPAERASRPAGRGQER